MIDIAKGERLATMLLDDLYQGANPSTVVCSADSAKLWISHAGVHEISMINLHPGSSAVGR